MVSYGSESDAVNGAEGRIDIFDSEGFFITEVADPSGPKSVAVDSAGNMYVYNYRIPTGAMSIIHEVVRYSPIVYDPAAGEIAYGNSPAVVQSTGNSFTALAINWANDHLFVNNADHITEYGSALEDNHVIDESIGAGVLSNFMGTGLAIDAARGRIYANDEGVVDIFDLGSHALIGTIERSDTPAGGAFAVELSVAVDEQTGDVFVYDGGGSEVVYQFDVNGDYQSTVAHSFQHVNGALITVDNGPHSPNAGYLYVPSHPSGPGHLFAFAPNPSVGPPTVDALPFPEVTETEALLLATINPHNGATTYSFQYVTLQEFEEHGFENAEVAGEGSVLAGAAGVQVSAQANGLTPGIAYRFRIVATNVKGTGEAEGAFDTYASQALGGACSNGGTRVGLSALLPDCRAYELVTPPDTNAREPIGVGHLGSSYFATLQAAPSGNALNFQIEGGALPGTEATGSFAGDPYLATRGPDGWTTAYTGPTGEESPALLPGSNSPDQGYSFWGTASGKGTAAIGGQTTNYVRYPDGHFALVGRGSLATDPQADGKLIAPNGSHILFVSSERSGHVPVQLEEDAPPTGTQAIYDRTPDEVTHVVSLLPGDLTPAAGEDAIYLGASLDGEGVAFSIGEELYLRYRNAETYAITEGATFAGIAEGGGRIFYLKAGNIFAFDVASKATIDFSSSGDVIPVNVSADGSTAYFTSLFALSGKTNPLGAKPKAGKPNLYVSREGAISFVGTVTTRDVEGENPANEVVEGLGLWTTAVGPSAFGGPGRFGEDPSRTTPDGTSMVFESRANVTSYDSGGHVEVYRYNLTDQELDCLSCNPTGAPATGKASLQSVTQEQGGQEPFSSYALVKNLRPDGHRVFFQSNEALVAGDTDQLQDVYEWEAQGVGSCAQAGGCLYLISSGHSERSDYLFAVSESGDDVFFRTGDLLLPADADETPSIYDARVDGGFLEMASAECEGEGCRDGLEPPPGFAPPATNPATAAVRSHRRCPKGRHKVRRHGKVRCVKEHHRHHHHRHAGAKKGAGK